MLLKYKREKIKNVLDKKDFKYQLYKKHKSLIYNKFIKNELKLLLESYIIYIGL